MGQKPRLPRSITLTKTVKIRVKISKTSGHAHYSGKAWSTFLSSIKARNTGESTDSFLWAIRAVEKCTLLDIIINANSPIKITFNDKHKTPIQR